MTTNSEPHDVVATNKRVKGCEQYSTETTVKPYILSYRRMTIEFGYTRDPEKVDEIYAISSVEWNGGLSTQDYCLVERTRFTFLKEKGTNPILFYLRDTESGKLVTSTGVFEVKGLFKRAPSPNAINTVPDIGLIGVNNATFLCVTHVFTHPEYRKKGLALQLIEKAIEYVENELIEKEIANSNDSPDSFRNNVVTDGHIDRSLANYYLSSKYFWYLYSAVGSYYEKAGFKPYPIDFFKVPLSLVNDESQTVVEDLIHGTGSHFGKSIKLLSADSRTDQDLIQFILQSKEIEMVSELNKLSFHSELQGQRKSSTSLQSISSLQMSPLSHQNLLSSIPGTGLTKLEPKTSHGDEEETNRRRSSVVTTRSAKVAIKPDYNFLSMMHRAEQKAFSISTNDEVKKYANVQGAIITNKLQQKSYYILWATLMLRRTYILGMGEVQYEQLPVGPFGAGGARRRSSFTGINELGAHNLKDLEILLTVACYITKKRQRNDGYVYVSTTELPFEIPDEVLHDFLTNYMNTNVMKEDKIERVTSEEIQTLPMLRKFGSKTSEFDLDWNFVGAYSWD